MSAPCCTHIDLDVGGWTTVNEHVYARDRVDIRRGAGQESGRTDPSTCAVTLRSDNGRYSPRNPVGPYYGLLTGNTPLRAGAKAGGMFMSTTVDGYAETPDAAALDVTGDIELRVEYRLAAPLTPGGLWEWAGKYGPAGQRSWRFLVFESGGDLWGNLGWSPDGTNLVQSSRPLPPVGNGRVAVRVALDVNNGAGGWTARWFWAPTFDGLGDPDVEQQMGTDSIGAGTTSIFSSTAPLQVGGVTAQTFPSLDGDLYRFEMRNSAGTVVASPDFTAHLAGTPSFNDAQGRTWTLHGDAEITNMRWRFHGEVPEWVPQWNDTEQAMMVPITAAGITRRLSQGQSPVESTYHRGLLASAGLVAYWPAEDGKGSTRLASALAGGLPMDIIGSPDLSSFAGFDASAPIPLLKDAEFNGRIPAYTDTGAVQVRFLLSVPDNGSVDGQSLIRIHTSGTATRWEFNYVTGGALELAAYDEEGTELFSQASAFAVDGKLLRAEVRLQQDGADVDWAMRTLEPGITPGLEFSGTLNSRTVGRAKRVLVNPGGGHTDVAIGHISVQSVITSLFEAFDELAAYSGETAGRRFQRLCVENDIAFTHIGDLDDTARMGAQLPKTLLDLLWEVVDTDLGILYEPRDFLGIGYRTRESLYNQPAQVELECCGDEPDLAGPLRPAGVDRTTRNDITVNRQAGSSVRAVKETGALSVQPPPDGVGRYDDTDTVNVESDLNLPDQADHRLLHGTVDEDRFPSLEVELMNPAVADRIDALLDADLGDRVLVDEPPVTVKPEPVDVLVYGYTEEFADLADLRYRLTFAGAPASPWDVAVFTDDDAGGDDDADGPWARYGPLATTLDEDLDTTETGVNIDAGVDVWTTDGDHYPFDIVVGGERMTATGIGALGGGIYTLTVVRSVNGVVKGHDTGAAVRLARPAIRPL